MDKTGGNSDQSIEIDEKNGNLKICSKYDGTVYAWDGGTCDMHLQGEVPADHGRDTNRKRAISA